MTNEQLTAMHNFEARVRQLMMAYREKCARIETLQNELKALQKKLSEAEKLLEDQRSAYARLKTARMIEVSGDDIKESRARLARLIRDVDACIAMLDV